MKNLKDIISERLKLSKDNNLFIPKTIKELRKEIQHRIDNKIFDFNDIDISNIEDLSWLFAEENIINIDISNWDVSHVKNMNAMFYNCRYLHTCGDLSSWDVSNVTDMTFMFSNCKNLKDIGDLSNWKINNTKMHMAFNNCSKLKTLGDIYNWNPKESNWDIFPLCDCKPLPKRKP